jgi:hypothetical protein
MTREEQIIEAGAYHSCGCRPPKTCGHNMHELAYINRNLAFEAGAKWADEHPNTEDIETVLAYTYKGLGWLLENIEPDMGTTRERALGCVEVLQQLCMDVITARKE